MHSFIQLSDNQIGEQSGRGEPKLVEKFRHPLQYVRCVESDAACAVHMCARARVLQVQITRIQQWMQRLKTVIAPSCSLAKRLSILALNVDNAKIIASRLDLDCDVDRELKLVIDQGQPSDAKCLMKLAQICKEWQHELEKHTRDATSGTRDLADDKLLKDRYQTAAYKTIRGPSALPLQSKRQTEGPNGEPIGSSATNPNEVNEIFIDGLQQIYDGSVPKEPNALEEHADNFVRRYSDVLFQSTEFEIGDLIPEDLQYVCG